METSIRIILLAAGCIVLLGIAWDMYRNRGKRQKRKGVRRSHRIPLGDTTFTEMEEVVLKRRNSAALLESQDIDNTIIALYVMARKPGVFLGKKIVDALKEVHLVYGDMQIFHRYENIDGTGQKMFSVTSAVEPGIFELEAIETLATPGITLFFILARPNYSITAFELMLRTAKQLALRLDGEVRDDNRRLLTAQTVEQYRERVRAMPVLQSSNAF